jgi:ParB family chromosome partitioning protein
MAFQRKRKYNQFIYNHLIITTMKKEVEKTVQETAKRIIAVALSKIVVSGLNPRKSIHESELQELADSIKQVGVLQPVLVRPKGKKFEIVCG